MIESATERDLPEICALLERLHLPVAGVDDHLPTMLVAREGEQIVGTAALELYADGALLRPWPSNHICRAGSLVISSQMRRCSWPLTAASRPCSC